MLSRQKRRAARPTAAEETAVTQPVVNTKRWTVGQAIAQGSMVARTQTGNYAEIPSSLKGADPERAIDIREFDEIVSEIVWENKRLFPGSSW